MTIRQPDEFPNVDEMLDEAAQKRWAAVLDYREREADRADRRRHLAPWIRQGCFAVAMGAFFGGFAFTLAQTHNQEVGAAWMTVGAVVLGCIIPAPGSRTRKGNRE